MSILGLYEFLQRETKAMTGKTEQKYYTITVTILSPGQTPKVSTFTNPQDAEAFYLWKLEHLENDQVLQIQKHTEIRYV